MRIQYLIKKFLYNKTGFCALPWPLVIAIELLRVLFPRKFNKKADADCDICCDCCECCGDSGGDCCDSGCCGSKKSTKKESCGCCC